MNAKRPQTFTALAAAVLGLACTATAEAATEQNHGFRPPMDVRHGDNSIRLQNVTPGKAKTMRNIPINRASAKRTMSNGTELTGWLSYADNTSVARGLYDLTASGPELKWEDPFYVEEGVSPQTSWIQDGMLCGYAYQIIWGQLWNNVYVRYELETGDILETIDVDLYQGGSPSVMQTAAYDAGADIVYGYGQMNGSTAFMMADPTSPEILEVVRAVPSSDMCPSLCYSSNDGMLYGINQRREFVSIDQEGYQTVLFEIPTDNYGMYVTGLAHDPVHNEFHWNLIQGDSTSAMARIRPAQGEFEIYETFEAGETFTALFCQDDKLNPLRPNRPTVESIDFEEGSTTGEVTFTMPRKTMSGDEISGEITYTSYLDGAVHSEGTAKAGESLTVRYAGLTDSMHTFGLTVTAGGVTSTMSTARAYIGNDTPCTPQNVVLTDAEVTWDPVTEGIHNAYLDLDAMKYEVYINEELIGETADLIYPVTLPSDKPMSLYSATVRAVCNGMASEMSQSSNNVAAGEAMSIPVYLEPTMEEFEFMTQYDPDGAGWYFTELNEGNVVVSGYNYSGNRCDNWLFLPPFKIEDSSKLYSFSMNAFIWDEWYAEEHMEVMLCNSDSPEGVLSTVIEEFHPTPTSTKHSGFINAPQPGTYYVALHCTSAEWQLGVLANSFSITDENVTMNSPEAPTEITAEAFGEGELMAKISFNMPTATIGGTEISKDITLTATVACVTGEHHATGTSGERITIDIPTAQGNNILTITVSDGNLNGMPATVEVYTGVEIPADVTYLGGEVSADMMSVTLEWGAPVTGANGGYIDPAGVTYDIYRYEENFMGWYWQVYATGVEGNTFTYTCAPDEPQSFLYLGVATRNAAGSTGNFVTIGSLVGAPYTLPMTDSFNDPVYGATIQPWIPYAPDNDYAGQQWYFNYLAYLDGDYQGDTIGMVGTSWDANSLGMLGFPRFSTQGVSDASITLTLYNGPETPYAYFTGVYHDSEVYEFGEIQACDEKGFHTYTFSLPEELMDKDWVQLYLNVEFAESGQYIFIDSIEVNGQRTSAEALPNNRFAKGEKGRIEISGHQGEEITVTSIDGCTRGRMRFNSAVTTIPAAKGIYIVTTETATYKVMVK